MRANKILGTDVTQDGLKKQKMYSMNHLQRRHYVLCGLQGTVRIVLKV